MMDLMRKIAPIVIIIVVLGFGGSLIFGSYTNSRNAKIMGEAIGFVGKDKITRVEYDKAYQQANARIRGSELTDAQRRDLPMQVWEQIVSEKITDIISKEYNLGSTPEEILQALLINPPAALKQSPYFADKNGKFDINKYREIMTSSDTYDIPDIKQLEKYLKTMLPNKKLSALISEGNFVSPSEAMNEFHKNNDKISFQYVFVKPYKMVIDGNEISEKNVEDYYNSHKDEYKTDSKVDLYYIKVPKKATAFDEKELTKELKDIRARVESGESSFADEASMESDDDKTAEDGGVIGWMKKGDFPAFDTVFSLKTGEISEPIKTKLGLHIVMVDSINDSTGMYKLSHILKQIVPTVTTLDSLDALGQDMQRIAEEQGIFKAAEELNLKVDSTLQPIGKGELVPAIGYQSGMGAFLFNKDSDSKYELFEDERGYYLVTVKDRIEPGYMPIKYVTKEISEIIKDSLQVKKAEEYLQNKIKSVSSDSLLALADSDSLIIGGTTDTVTRARFVPSIGYDNKVIAVAFATELNKVSPVVTEENGIYAVKPIYKDVADTVSDADIDKYTKAIQNKRIKTLFTDWYRAFKDKIGVTNSVRKYYY